MINFLFLIHECGFKYECFLGNVMEMVLTPILKTHLPVKLGNPGSANRVKFNLPEEDNVIEYLSNEDVPYATKQHVIISKITSNTTEVIKFLFQ